ncbi:MAG: hypothetical protein IPP17_24505 [Bacteroidetes bacterium]|nr:hypothetical protein [Bacteroidota bacterium]
MKIRLRYFGMIAERLGKTAEEVEWEGSPNPIDPRAWLLQLHPVLAEMSWKVAVDQEIVDGLCHPIFGNRTHRLPEDEEVKSIKVWRGFPLRPEDEMS